VLSTLALLCLSPAPAGEEAHWPHWRGPTATGVATSALPTSWSDAENVRFRVEIPGRGMSTPVIWGERLFLTSAVPTAGQESLPPGEYSFEVLCLDRNTGQLLWRRVARVATPHEGHHRTYGSYASASPVTDGERLYVSFGSQGLYAYDLAGEPLWSFDPGVRLEMRNAFGEGLAPVVAGEALVQVCDQERDSFVFAVDRRTGKELWRVPRDEPSTWATPLVTSFDGELQVVTSGARRTRSYDPATGELLWQGGGAGLNAIPAVQRWQDLVLVMSGFREAKILALRPGPNGGADQPVAWSATKGCAYTASPVLADGLLYTVTDRGLISCFDAASGEALYLEQRLPRGSELKASPIAAGDFLYVPTEAGEVHLVKLGPELVVERTNTLSGETFIASPAAAGGALYLRGLTHLFCLAEPPRSGER
jgi:outer membrane protein assembly factor BamB